MTRFFICLFMMSLLISCKTDSKEQARKPISVSEIQKEFSVAEKIAEAHGYKHWNKVNNIEFTFNVNRGEHHFERSWSWSPKTDDVRLITRQDTINFNRKSVDSLSLNADKSFINDKYWLLVPFQLVWDKGTTITEPVKETAPISKTEMNKITLTYSSNGGYTPGDAYDIFFDNNYIIKEWVFREGNQDVASMTTTFENYETFNGIKIAKAHKMADSNFNLYFSDIKVH